ncbi:MAG: acyl-CoA dehydrogenase family protein [SAR324 cluster bacterium]|nr:acyl-CoA dehydrogenase family protein [SAR324 cluster bacterium]
MDFNFSEDHRVLKEAVIDFAKAEIAPRAAANDLNHEIHPEIISQLKELGFLGSYIPEEYGGAGMDFLSYVLIVEEISKACASTGVLISAHSSLCSDPIIKYGTEAQKKKFLPLLASGEKIGCFLLTEPNAGSDPGGLETCFHERDDHYELEGSKIFITNGGFLGLGIVIAHNCGPEPDRQFSAFIVDLQSEGVVLLKNENKMGIRGSYTSAFSLEGVKVPKENLLGAENEGFHIAMNTLNGGRIGIAAQSLGIAGAAFDLALEYAQTRKQFGRHISKFQAIQFKLADMATELECSKLLTYKAGWQKGLKQDIVLLAAQAKNKASETANFCANEALQIHGGYGYMADLPLERLYRDAKITEIYEGTSEVQRIIIARELLK